MSPPSSFTFPHQKKGPRADSVPYKAARSIWYIPPYIPHSYKILVPLIKIGERSPLSTRELIQFDSRLDRQSFVKLPEDVHLYLQQRGMQHEIQVWRERLTQFRNRLKWVDFPGAGGFIILGTGAKAPANPQHPQYDPKPLAELLEDFFGPIQKDQLTPAILIFYQKRELDQDTRIFDDWETLFWPKLSPVKLLTEVEVGWPGLVGRGLETVDVEATIGERNLKVSVEDVPEISKPQEQLTAPQALDLLGKGRVGKVEREDTQTPPPAPLAVATSNPRGTSHLTVRFEDDIGFTSAIPVHFHDKPSARGMPTSGPTPRGSGRGTQSTPATPMPPMLPIPGFQLVSGTKSAQVRRALDRFGSERPTPTSMFPQTHSTPVNGTVRRLFPSETHLKPSSDSAPEFTNGRAQPEGGSVDSRPRRKAFANYGRRDNIAFVLQKKKVYSNLKAFERWVWERILTPFIVIVVLYNALLVCWLAWEWRYGSYEAKVAEAHAEKATSRQDFSLHAHKGFRSGKLRERPNIRELDEDWPPLSSYEREREKELEWDKMAYLLELR